MDIGEIERVWESEPLEEPASVPEMPDQPARETEPDKQPEKIG